MVQALAQGGALTSSRRFKMEVAIVISALKACSNSGELEKGRMIHADAVESGVDTDLYVATTLVSMYARCGSLHEAERVFWRMRTRSVVSWNAFILGCVENGEEEVALGVFVQMEECGECEADARTYVAVIKACTKMAERERGSDSGDGKPVKERSLEKGMAVHVRAAERQLDTNSFVRNSLISMYCNCASLLDACIVFECMGDNRCVVSWTALIQGCAENGEFELALELFDFMLATNACVPDTLTFVAALKACSALASAEEGGPIDGRVVKSRGLETGRALHSLALAYGCERDVVFETSLVDMYVKCLSLVEAARVFDGMNSRTVASWNALMLGYAENGEELLALELLAWLVDEEETCRPDARTFQAAVKACIALATKENGVQLGDSPKLVKVQAMEKGMAVHSNSVSCGCLRDVFLDNTLVDMYAKCGSMRDAQKLFNEIPDRNVVSWNALLLGYAESLEGQVALKLFQCMSTDGCSPDSLTYVAALKACASLSRVDEVSPLEMVFALHSRAATGCKALHSVVSNTLMDRYVSLGSLPDAHRVFNSIRCPTLVSWNCLLDGYAEDGQGELALELFLSMQRENHKPDARTFSALLKSCGCAIRLDVGKSVHGELCRTGLENNEVLVTTLVDMYGRCGSMDEAQHVLDTSAQSTENSATVSSLLAGYTRQGDVHKGLFWLQQMQEEGLKPTASALVSVLAACSHAGMVETGKRLFSRMNAVYSVIPGIEHYVCLVDLLGRANQLEEAIQVITRMPCQPNSVIWTSFLASCSKWKNVSLANLAFERLTELGGVDGAAYTMLANTW